MPEKKRYGIGILGFGFIGKVHAYAHTVLPYFYDSLPFRSRLVGVCTSRSETAERAKDEADFEFCTTDPEEVIRCDDVDIVHICTPNSLHRGELLAAMDAGKHIYCDKPLTANLSEAKDVMDALEDYEGAHQVTFHNRFFPATMKARELAEDGFMGDLACFRASYLHSGSINPEKPLEWKLSGEMGGGVLNDLATHVIDLLQHIMGPFDSVFGSTRILYPERPSDDDPAEKVAVDAEDHACLTFRNDDGLTGTVEATKIATGMQDELRFEIHGTGGAVRFNLMSPDWLEVYDQAEPSGELGGERGFKKIECIQRYPDPGGSWPASKASIGWLRAHVACLYNFMSALHEGRRPEPGLETGYRVQRVVEATRESERKGTFVRIESV